MDSQFDSNVIPKKSIFKKITASPCAVRLTLLPPPVCAYYYRRRSLSRHTECAYYFVRPMIAKCHLDSMFPGAPLYRDVRIFDIAVENIQHVRSNDV
jgi:hypothetical protein